MTPANITTLMLQTARNSNMHTKYACIITYRGKIVSVGYNYYKTNMCFTNKHCILRT